jgi:transposase
VEEDDQKLRVRLVGRDGRRRYDPDSRDRLVAACLEPGISVSRLALDHGINANLLRKWIKKAKEVRPLPPSSKSAFVPVQVIRDRSLPMQGGAFALDMPARRGDERLAKSERKGPFSFPAKVSASLPNGVNLTLECSDLDALAAVIGALGHVQTER